jgi:environmental stress-induced protein Ves
MRIQHLRASDYRRMRWKNGGGWTTQLASAPDSGADGDFDWRISIAEIEADGAFSTFAQCDRCIALLDGNGMRLDFEGAPSVTLDQTLRFVAFSGDWKTQGTLLDGPVRDFNVIARRDRLRIDVRHRPLVGTMVFPAAAQVSWFVYLVSGSATLQDSGAAHAIVSAESLLLQPDEAMRGCVLDGAGDLLLVKLTRL